MSVNEGMWAIEVTDVELVDITESNITVDVVVNPRGVSYSDFTYRIDVTDSQTVELYSEATINRNQIGPDESKVITTEMPHLAPAGASIDVCANITDATQG